MHNVSTRYKRSPLLELNQSLGASLGAAWDSVQLAYCYYWPSIWIDEFGICILVFWPGLCGWNLWLQNKNLGIWNMWIRNRKFGELVIVALELELGELELVFWQ